MLVVHIEANGKTNTAQYVSTLVESLENNKFQIKVATSSENVYSENTTLPFFGTYGVSTSYAAKALKYARGLYKLLMYLEKQGKDSIIVHYHWPKLSFLDYFFFKKLFNSPTIKVVATVHNNLPHEKKFFDKYFFRKIYGLTNFFLFHNLQNRNDFSKIFFDPVDKSEIVPHYSYPISYDDSQLKKNTILFFGSIRSYKGLDVLIKAAKKVSHHEGWNLVVAGKPQTDISRITILARELEIQGKVKWELGWISKERLDQLFRGSQIIVLPYKKIDNSGVVNLAMSYGKVVIASNIGGMSDVITDGVDGVLVPPNNPDKLAEALELVLTNSEHQNLRMGKKAWEKMKNEYSIEKIAKKINIIYSS